MVGYDDTLQKNDEAKCFMSSLGNNGILGCFYTFIYINLLIYMIHIAL